MNQGSGLLILALIGAIKRAQHGVVGGGRQKIDRFGGGLGV